MFIKTVKTLGFKACSVHYFNISRNHFWGIPERLCFWQIWIFAQLRLAHQTGAKKNGGFVFPTFYDTPKTIHVSQRTFSCRTLLHCYCTLLFLSIGVRTVEAKVPVELTSKTVLPHSCACRELLEAGGEVRKLAGRFSCCTGDCSAPRVN